MAQPPRANSPSSIFPSFRHAQLRNELSYYREAAGLTQTDAARLLGCTQGKVQKIESGVTRTIKEPDLVRMLEVYGVPADEVEELRALLDTGVDGRVAYPTPRGVPRWFRRYYRLESQVRELLAYNPDEPHGLVQHPGYAQVQFKLANVANLEDHIRTRAERFRAVMDREPRPVLTFIMGESALTRTMGDPVIALAQLRHTLMLSRQPRVMILVIPFEAALSHAGHEFARLKFPVGVSSDVAYVETEIGAQYWDGAKELMLYLRRWETLRAAALGPRESQALIQRKIRQLEQGEIQP